TEIQRRNARCSAVQYRKSIPAVLYRTKLDRRFRGMRSNGRAVFACKRACAHENERTFGCFQRVRELAASESGETLGAGAKIIIIVGKVGLLADETNREIAGPPTVAYARVEHDRHAARILPDDQQRVRLLDAGNGCID